MYRGFRSRGVQISDSELPESIIRIMFRGSGLGDVQNSNSEHLQGTKYLKIHRMEAKGGKKNNRKPSGPARAAARPFSFAEALLNEVEPGFNTPMRRWRGGLPAAAMPPTHRGMECVVRGRVVRGSVSTWDDVGLKCGASGRHE